MGKVVDAIAAGGDVAAEYGEHFAPRFRDPARARAACQVYWSFLLHEYPHWVRGGYAGRGVTAPVLWLHGLQDPFFTPRMFKDIREHADAVRHRVPARRRPLPAEECPQAVAEHLRAFFSSGT